MDDRQRPDPSLFGPPLMKGDVMTEEELEIKRNNWLQQREDEGWEHVPTKLLSIREDTEEEDKC